MSSLTSLFFHPLLNLNLWFDDDNEQNGIDVIYPLTLFVGFGIWLVFSRYQKAHNSAVEFSWPAPPPADPLWTSVYISDAKLNSHLENADLLPAIHMPDRKYITSFDPGTGLHIETSLADNEQDIHNKIAITAEAQKKWRTTTFTQRRRVIKSLMKWLVENQEDCARVACRDTGKTLIDAALGEILTTCSKMEWLISRGESVLKPESRASNKILCYKKSQVHYEPLGVVAAIVSWNYPLHNAWSPILASIFAGNGVILKCSESVVWSTRWFVGVITECLKACGHDPELVQVVCCWPEEADALTMSPSIKHITFIGSETVGRKVAAAALENLTPVTLELGGKDPAIILPGTDLNRWASIWMRGIFQNAGQNCIGIERLIVHEGQYDDLENIITALVERLRSGSVMAHTSEGYIHTVDGGAMISSDRFPGLQNLIREAQDAGANVVGGTPLKHVYLEHGSYFAPSVVGPVTATTRIAQEELFAPVAVLMKYTEVDEAIEIANGTRYGLGASVFGPSQSDCISVAKQLECGMVSINDFGVFYLNQDLPFGGTKNSGYGRFGGPEGLRALTNPKAIMVDRFPRLIQTKIPQVLDYPVRSLLQSWEFASGLVGFLYADGYRKRFRGLMTLMKVLTK